MIKDAKKPFIFTGGGTIISEASKEVTELAHKIDAPVCDSLWAKVDFPAKILLYRNAWNAWNKSIKPRRFRV